MLIPFFASKVNLSLSRSLSEQDRVVQHVEIFTLRCEFGLTIHFRLVKLNLKFRGALTVEKRGRTCWRDPPVPARWSIGRSVFHFVILVLG